MHNYSDIKRTITTWIQNTRVGNIFFGRLGLFKGTFVFGQTYKLQTALLKRNGQELSVHTIAKG